MTHRRDRKQPSEAHDILNARGAERTDALEKANEDLKAAQAELQRRWLYLAEAQRLSHSGTFGWKVDSGELLWSDETYRILGFTRETNPTLDLVFDRIHPEDLDRMRDVKDHAAQNGMDLDVEHRIFLPDGAVKYLHAVAHAGRDSSGNLEYMGVVTDITERKRADEERQALSRKLEESNARLEEAQRVAHLGYWIWNLETNRVVFSNETCRIYGIKPQEDSIDLAAIRELIHPEDRGYVFENAERAVRDGVHIETEHRLIRPSGEIRIVYSRGDLTRDASGRPYEMFGTCQDITERKQAEEERQALSRDLQESNARLEEAQRVAHVGYWEWDLETGEVIWSDETYRIFGLKPQERPMDLATVRGMVHPEDREALYSGVDVEIDAGVHPVAEFRIVTPSGEVRTVHAITSKLWGVMPGDPDNEASGKDRRLFGTVQDITERKRAEEELQVLYRELQESEASLEEAQRVAHVGSWVWDLEKNHVTYSDEYYRVFGLAPGNGPIDIATVREMIHPEDRDYVFRTAEEAIRSGTRAECEHRILRPNGEIRIVHSLGDLKKDASGRPYQMFGVSQDVTDRKLAEQALRRSQFYLSEGERLAHMGSWASRDLGIRWSDDLNIYWSDEVYKIYGLDPKNGAPNLEQYLAAIHPQDRASMAETVKVMHEQRCGCDITNRIVRPDGELRYVRCVGVPVFEDGVFQGFHGTTMDVTGQELLTQELRREQAYLAEAQSLTHVGSWACNLATREIFHSSDENARLYGFDPSRGPIPFDLFYSTILPEDERIIRAKLENAISAGADYDVEFRIRRTDGDIRFLRGIGHHNPSQEIGEYFGITMDITDRKRAEEERERLRQLEADLAHINRVNMMGELAAALAHEIKQPIAASITSANALLRWLAHDPPDLERAREAAAWIEEDANRAADVINSLQSFYKTGMPAERQIVNVKDIIEEMTVLLRTEAVRYSVTIKAELKPDLPSIRANRVQLQQVFMNLMLNAIEAMKDSGGELTIRLRMSPENRLYVSISDTGVGLPVDFTEEIFDPFHTTKPQGTGMGLTITRSIVESYGGRVWATTNEGAGATFHFTLPAETEASV
jgi:PAS domain S-box-containing protein